MFVREMSCQREVFLSEREELGGVVTRLLLLAVLGTVISPTPTVKPITKRECNPHRVYERRDTVQT